jgi:hypothetical protein
VEPIPSATRRDCDVSTSRTFLIDDSAFCIGQLKGTHAIKC